jgi:hypothetical protein
VNVESMMGDGSTHQVLKSIPTEKELCLALEGLGSNVRIAFLKYYWIASYVPESTR